MDKLLSQEPLEPAPAATSAALGPMEPAPAATSAALGPLGPTPPPHQTQMRGASSLKQRLTRQHGNGVVELW